MPILTSKIKEAFTRARAGLKIKEGILTLDLSGLGYGEIKKLSNLVYHLPVFFGKKYFIRILGIPYCLMPKLQIYIDFKPTKGEKYAYSKNCLPCKFKTNCPGLPVKLRSSGIRACAIPDIPLDIAIELNNTCNLNCKCCSKNKSAPVKLPFKNIKKALIEAKLLGIRYLRFTGGEPLLRKDLEKILAYARSMGFNICLNTNGFLLNKDILRKIEKNVDNILFSLCGWERDSETLLTGRTTGLEEKLANIIRARNSKIPYLRIGTVVSKMLIDNFDNYTNLIRKLGVMNWELYRPFLSSPSTEARNYYDLNTADFLITLNNIKKLKKTGMNAYLANAIPFCISKGAAAALSPTGSMIDDGHTRLVLDPKGYFKPSYFLDKNLGRSIKRAWKHPFIRRINSLDYLPIKCQSCRYLKWCLGGSRLAAKMQHRSLFSPDPLMYRND